MHVPTPPLSRVQPHCRHESFKPRHWECLSENVSSILGHRTVFNHSVIHMIMYEVVPNIDVFGACVILIIFRDGNG